MPADRNEPERARTVPDGVAYWLGAVVLAASALVRSLRALDGAALHLLARRAWPWACRLGSSTTRQLAGLLARSLRAAPAWCSARRAKVALWAAATEVAARRASRRALAGVIGGARTFGRSPVSRRWGARAARAGLALGVLVAGALVASEPILSGVARLSVGDEVRRELPDLSETSVVVAAEGSTLGVVEEEHRRVVDADTLPEHVTAAVLAAEDHRFPEHEGYDLAGLARATLTNARAREVEQGGSTITQQLAKLNFTDGAHSIGRKVEELLYAVRLEDELSKEQLLERYLNQVYFGNGAHGIAAAAEEYFAVAPQDLSLGQAAVLASIIQAPNALDPRGDPDDVRRRRDAVLDRAADEGLITRTAAETAALEPIQVAPPSTRPRANPVLDAVRAEVRTIEELGPTPEARLERLATGGLRVETTLDPSLQHVVAEAVRTAIPEGSGATAAVAAVDPATGAIRALGSGRGGAGGFDLARQGRRQPGSTFKPLTAVAALERGLSPDQRLVGDGPVELDHGGPEPWRVDNFEGTDVGGVDLRGALRRSVNTAFAQLGVAVGAPAIADVADRMGIDVEAALGPPDQRGPSLALGGVTHGVTPLELAGAYATFANDGKAALAHLVHRIVDAEGEVVYEREPRAEQVVDPAVTATVRSMLADALAGGTGRAARITGVEAFGKTGTSQDAADAWFVGSTTNLTTAVWVGHPDGRVPMSEATGGTLAAPVWRQVTEAWLGAHPSGTWEEAADLDDQPGLDLPRARRTR
ncbi:MAG TPA: transglycosylase domain-containing protein [Acidimicrobiales bacterium]|nr:transglycosylase domain-containing protein [Acidimicrobiales bacterium]